MSMKEHILAALREQFNRWDSFLGNLSDAQTTTPQFDDNWSILDVIAHLWAWQQISIARVQAAALNQEPNLPNWVVALHEDWEENADATNAWIYKAYHEKPWSEVYQNWREGFLQLLELAKLISERDLLDGSRYSWLGGYPLALILLGTYDHHLEHSEELFDGIRD